MKHNDYFKNLMDNTVNLSKWKLDILSGRVDSIYTALRNDAESGALFKGKIPQGSWPQKTIINPVNARPFDGDFMVRMDYNPDWADDLKQYGDTVYKVLHRTSPYQDMPHGRKCRCVYVNYANNAMHVDIVPFIVDANDHQWIVNRDDNVWERTDTDGFTDWMKAQDKIANRHLREVIRIMKYLRDHKNSWTGTKSILLTTMLGMQVEEWRKIGDAGYYSDLPTALLHIVSDLNDWLQARPSRPVIYDPSGSGTDFHHRWTDETYNHFRARIKVHAADIDAAYHETDHDESVKKWQALFGDAFKAPKTAETSSRYSNLGPAAAAAAGTGAATVSHTHRAG